MFQLGVTGGIGSGKSLVCSVLEKLGIPVFDADDQARKLMNDDPRVKKKIEALLGKNAYREGSLDRSFVASIVFADPVQLMKLNAIVHPLVRDSYRRWVNCQSGAHYVVEEAAILFESGAHRLMDMVALVYAPEDIRIRRVMERDGVTEANVRQRMKHQMDEEEKRKLADVVIMNDGSELLLPRIIDLHKKILNSS